jgi:hypothetical protein
MRPAVFQPIYQNFLGQLAVMPRPFEETLAELPESSQLSNNLFTALIEDPRALLADYVEHPEDYAHELLPLLVALINKSKTWQDLTEEERTLLNQATPTFVSHSNTSKPSGNEPPTKLLTKSDGDDSEEEEVPWGPNEGQEISLENFELPEEAGWWRNSF